MAGEFADIEDLIARSRAGEDIRITMEPRKPEDDHTRWIPNELVAKMADAGILYAGDTHVADHDCPMCEAGDVPKPSPTLRSEFASPEMQRFKDALEKYHQGDEELVRAMREYALERKREQYAALFEGLPKSTLVALSLAGIESRILHHEIARHRAMDVPVITFDIGDRLYDEAHMMPKLRAQDVYIEPKKPKGDYVGRFGDMPVPPKRNRKFKKRLQSHKGRKRR